MWSGYKRNVQFVAVNVVKAWYTQHTFEAFRPLVIKEGTFTGKCEWGDLVPVPPRPVPIVEVYFSWSEARRRKEEIEGTTPPDSRFFTRNITLLHDQLAYTLEEGKTVYLMFPTDPHVPIQPGPKIV